MQKEQRRIHHLIYLLRSQAVTPIMNVARWLWPDWPPRLRDSGKCRIHLYQSGGERQMIDQEGSRRANPSLGSVVATAAEPESTPSSASKCPSK